PLLRLPRSAEPDLRSYRVFPSREDRACRSRPALSEERGERPRTRPLPYASPRRYLHGSASDNTPSRVDIRTTAKTECRSSLRVPCRFRVSEAQPRRGTATFHPRSEESRISACPGPDGRREAAYPGPLDE